MKYIASAQEFICEQYVRPSHEYRVVPTFRPVVDGGAETAESASTAATRELVDLYRS